MSALVPLHLVVISLLAGLPPATTDHPSAAALQARYQREKAPVWADAETASFFYRGQADQVTVIFGGDIRQLSRVPNSDVWTITVHLPKLQQGSFDYQFYPSKKGHALPRTPDTSGVWRGSHAPAPPVEAARLHGTLKQLDMASRALGGRRSVTVYLPPGHDPRKPSHVVYATDGENIARYAYVLEPLITTGRIPPTVLIGVHSGGYLGGPAALQGQKYDPHKDLRAQEYFPGLNAQRFSNHATFFCTEVPAWAEKHFGVSRARPDWVIFGYSNGGRFAAEMGLRHPDVFGHVFAFSVAGNGKFDFGAGRKQLPRWYLAAGTWDIHFHRCTSRLAEQLRQRGVPVHFSSRIGGHDGALWRDEFAAALQWAWGEDGRSGHRSTP